MIFSMKMICSRFTAEWLEDNNIALSNDPVFNKKELENSPKKARALIG